MPFTDLEGSLVDLKLVESPASIAKLHEHLKSREERLGDVARAPEMDKLKKRLFTDKSLVVWEVYRKGGGPQHGYFGVVSFSGPSFIYYDPFDRKPDFDIAQDATLAVLPAFFKNTSYDELFVHIPREYEDIAHGPLVEAGFDPIPEMPFWDKEKFASFVIQRRTYEIYYEEADEEAEAY